MRRGPARRAALVGAVASLLLAASSVSAALLPLWTIAPTAFTAYAGQAKTVTFTAKNLSPPLPATFIGCVRVNVPNSVHLDSSAIVSPATGWTANTMGGGVEIRATNSAARLGVSQSVQFSITMTPNKTGALLFSAFAFEQLNCSTPLGGSQPIAATILPPLVPTPTPVPTASPIPTATPAPTANPTATSRPTATPAQTPGPGATATPTPTPGGIGPGPGSPSPTPSPSATASAGGSSPSSGVPTPSASLSGLSVGSNDGHGDGRGISIDIGAGTPMDGIEWTVPFATLGTPGLALIVWVAIQAGGGIIWLPLVRRLRRARRRPLSRSA